MADGDDFRPHEDEGDFRQGGGFRIHAAENRGGHEARSVLRVQTAGGLNLPHFVIGRHFQPAEAFPQNLISAGSGVRRSIQKTESKCCSAASTWVVRSMPSGV